MLKQTLLSAEFKGAVRVAVIGTAGRQDDAKRVQGSAFAWMLDKTRQQLASWKLSNRQITLVSGASAWADHVAVRLFLEAAKTDDPFAGLQLHLPCAFDDNRKLFDPQNRSGATLNSLHRQCSSACNFNSLSDIASARELGAELTVHKGGFLARNTHVAKADRVIAFTFWPGNPTDRKSVV